MTKEKQLNLKHFFSTPEGEAVKEKFIDILVRHIDIRNDETRSPEIRKEAVNMFIEFIEELFGEIDKLNLEAEIEKKKRKILKNLWYHNEYHNEEELTDFY